MSTSYHVYANDGAGGPIDYTSIVATTASLTWLSGSLAAGSDHLYAVRAFDTVSGLEEQNVDAVVRVVLDASQIDITMRPDPPAGLTVLATAAGGCRVFWHRDSLSSGAVPTGFSVYRTAGSVVNWASSPVATVTYQTGKLDYFADLTGLSHGVEYAIGVRAVNTYSHDGNTAQVIVTGDTTGPDAVDGLTGVSV